MDTEKMIGEPRRNEAKQMICAVYARKSTEHTYSDDGNSGAKGALTYAEGPAPLFTLPRESASQKPA